MVVVADNGIDGDSEALERKLHTWQILRSIPHYITRKKDCDRQLRRRAILLNNNTYLRDNLLLKALKMCLCLGLRVTHNDKVEASGIILLRRGNIHTTKSGKNSQYKY